MSILRKIQLCLISTVILIMTICSVSVAFYSTKDLSVGKQLDITFGDYSNNSNIFCLEKGQSLTWDNYYKVVSNVKITGTKSTDHNGKTIDNKDNAKFAYILWSSKNTNKGEVSDAVWNFGYKWMSSVGQYHAGLYKGFASSVTSNSSKINTEAETYANSLTNAKAKAEDKTNKDKISVKTLNKDNTQYVRVGPFKWKFGGNLSEIKLYDQNNKAISNVLFSTFSGDKENYINNVKDIKSEQEFYASVPLNSDVTKISKLTGKTNISEKTANIWFLESKAGYKQNLIIVDPGETTEPIEISFNYDIPLLGNLKVIKVVKGNETLKLQNVGFVIQNSDTKKYVKETNKQISYVDKKEDATEYITDVNGEIKIDNLIVGNYVAFETKNPNYGYEIIKDGIPVKVVVDKTEELKIQNEQKFIKISGYVWEDKQASKSDIRNDLYKTNGPNYEDDKDSLKGNVTVRLKSKKTKETIKETKTVDNTGAYQFIDVLVDDLNDYFIEFEYDGFTYTNVKLNVGIDTGSKAKESEQERDEKINSQFAKVENNKIINNNGNERQVSYVRNEDHTSTLNLNSDGKLDFPITASTEEAKYYIDKLYTTGMEEIKNINLGLYRRDMPDIAIVKDLSNVKITVNGKAHVYEYSQRFLNPGNYGGEGFNVGVKFKNEYGSNPYTRAIYKADYEYQTEDKSKELEVYVTYDIRVRNQSNLKAKVNSIVDYYDARYELFKIGTESKEGNIIGEIEKPTVAQYDNNTKYNKAIIDANTEIESGKDSDIYVQFKLNREAVLNILNGKENLNNVAEINSYSVYKDNKIYAGIDIDSNPGNAIPEDKTTYEDDTDEAPGLLLEVANGERKISGKVFLDATSEELKTGEIREGSGKYEDGETGIQNVKVTLKENSGSGKVYTADLNDGKTDENGEYTISGFIPGDYTLTYTWGDNTYTVQNYKGTIWTKANIEEKQNNGDKWYKNQTIAENGNAIRFSDAMDEYSVSQSRDDMKEMNSTTPSMKLDVEITSTTTTSFDDRFIPEGYKIENIDFGIVERARQRLSIDKRVKSFKVTTSGGQVIVDATVNEDGTLSGEKRYITYMKPSATTIPNNGFLRLELDDELIQGTNVDVTYEIGVRNDSEVDYLSDEFYRYGTQIGDKVTITPAAIVDYLDSTYKFDKDKNSQWNIKKLDDIKEFLDRKVYEDEESSISNKMIVYTETLNNKKLIPGQSETLNINVSKELANSDEISLDNEVEVIKVEKDGGAPLDSTPGNYIPGKPEQQLESDNSQAETIIITPSY